jgi:hypothetical protein
LAGTDIVALSCTLSQPHRRFNELPDNWEATFRRYQSDGVDGLPSSM